MTVYVVCATPVGSSASSGAAAHAQGARIIKKTVTKIHRPAAARH